MSVLEFVASLVRSLAWPAAVVIIAVLLRHQLRALLSGPLRRLRAGPFEVEWERAVSEVEAELDRPTPPEPGPLSAELRPLALASPEAAITEAFGRVERELRQLLGNDLAAARSGAPTLARMAVERNLITPDTRQAVESLAVLRNLAVHTPVPVTTKHAREFIAISEAVLYALSYRPE